MAHERYERRGEHEGAPLLAFLVGGLVVLVVVLAVLMMTGALGGRNGSDVSIDVPSAAAVPGR